MNSIEPDIIKKKFKEVKQQRKLKDFINKLFWKALIIDDNFIIYFSDKKRSFLSDSQIWLF